MHANAGQRMLSNTCNLGTCPWAQLARAHRAVRGHEAVIRQLLHHSRLFGKHERVHKTLHQRILHYSASQQDDQPSSNASDQPPESNGVASQNLAAIVEKDM